MTILPMAMKLKTTHKGLVLCVTFTLFFTLVLLFLILESNLRVHPLSFSFHHSFLNNMHTPFALSQVMRVVKVTLSLQILIIFINNGIINGASVDPPVWPLTWSSQWKYVYSSNGSYIDGISFFFFFLSFFSVFLFSFHSFFSLMLNSYFLLFY